MLAIASPQPAVARQGRVRRVGIIVGKLGIGVFVFLTLVGGWLYYQVHRDDGAPLPDDVGRQGMCSIWFIGSSSIHKWTSMGADMKPWIAHNRGVDGASLPYILRRFGAVRETPPQAIMFYAGENDIARGATAPEAIARLEEFLALKTQAYGALPVFVVSLKPSPTRWGFLPQQTDFNRAARRIAGARGDVTYVDIVPQLLVNRRPGPFYKADGVHMNPDGYRIWAKTMQAALDRALPSRVVDRCAG